VITAGKYESDWAFRRYETVRHRLPQARFPAHTQSVDGLLELAQWFDTFLLDAFGVLNVGETVIASALRAVASLQSQGKRVLVLTNGATFPAEVARMKFKRLGFNFARGDIVSSRDALCQTLRGRNGRWGVMGTRASQLKSLPVDCTLLLDDIEVYNTATGFILLSTIEWTRAQQDRLLTSLRRNPRPVYVGNPDLVAPRESGLTLEPGHYAHVLADATGVTPQFCGKPFGNVFDLALSRLQNPDPARIVMVGDSLHTDILGGAAYGLKTALVTGHGLFAGRDVRDYTEQSGIVPDFTMTSP